MNKEPKKRISIGVPLDMLEKIEKINQDEFKHMKIQNVIKTMISLSFLAIDNYGGLKIAWGVMEQEIKERKQEPAIIPSHGIVLEFPFGKRLPAG